MRAWLHQLVAAPASLRAGGPWCILVAWLSVFVLSTLGATEYRAYSQGAEGWIIPMPLGHELDVQRNPSGSMRVYRQTP